MDGEGIPEIPFEHYADDVICHCRSEAEATQLRHAIDKRFESCHLELHPQKTKIVYCKDDRRTENVPAVQFIFLGYALLEEIARKANPVIRGWINHCGSYYRSALYRVFDHLETSLTRWTMKKYRPFKLHRTRAREWLLRVKRRQPSLFAHWAMLPATVG